MGPQRQFNIAMEIGPLIDDLANWVVSITRLYLYGIIYGIKTTNQIISGWWFGTFFYIP